MERSPSSLRRQDEPEFNLREWGLRARLVCRENTNSRRFSASNLRSFREDARSFRSNMTISSTASSPGYSLREEIDPSTYSFTTALKALQARSVHSWECLSPDGLALNSKWNDAEKYISNPLSGEVPMECLSAKTLSGRSFHHSTSRITMSAPLIYPSHSRLVNSKHTPPTTITLLHHDNVQLHFPIQEKKLESRTRDVGTQSTPPELSSSSPTPAPTPPIEERSKKCSEPGGDSCNSTPIGKSEEELVGVEVEVEVKETIEKEERKRRENDAERKKGKQMCRCKQGGCLSWRSLWRRRRTREKHKPQHNNDTFLYYINGCSIE